MIQTKEMLEKWVKLNGARPGDDKILGKLLPKPKKPILSGGVESRHARGSDSAETANDSQPEAIIGDTVRRSGSSAPPAQTSSQKEAARKKKWQQKNKKKLADYQKKWRARNK